MGLLEDVRSLSDDALEKDLRFLSDRERHALPKLLAHLAEFDARQLCARRRYSDLFSYCVRSLGYEEGEAYRRIRAARVIRRCPQALSRLESGKVSLSVLVALSPVIQRENGEELLRRCEGLTRREVEAVAASIAGVAERPDWMRRTVVAGGWTVGGVAPPEAKEALPGTPLSPGAAPEGRPSAGFGGRARPWEWQATVPLSLERVRIGFDAGMALMVLLDRARQLLRHKYPEGRYEDVLRDALEVLLDKKDPQRRLGLRSTKTGPSGAPRGHVAPVPASAGESRSLGSLNDGRYIPARVKSAVWQRDGGRCAWRYEDGTVCGSKEWIEFDHVVPFARGGRSDTPRNLRLLCRRHNQEAAVSAFGEGRCGARTSPGAGGSA